MRKLALLASLIFAATSIMSCKNAAQRTAEDDSPEKIIAMERAALDRWGKGDPQGYLDTMDMDLTYFDPLQEKRLDGLPAMKEFIKPFIGKIKIDRYEMISPKVQRDGNVAVLTFNLVTYNKQPDGKEKVTTRWNSTEVYRLIDGIWKIIHSHWSYIKPELKEQS